MGCAIKQALLSTLAVLASMGALAAASRPAEGDQICHTVENARASTPKLGAAGGNRICRFALNATDPTCESSDALFQRGVEDSDAWAIVDVLVWPTRAWVASHGGWEPAMARLRAATAQANRIHAQSDTRIQLRFDVVRNAAWEPTHFDELQSHPEMLNASVSRGGDLVLVIADVNEALNTGGCRANHCGYAISPRFGLTENNWAFNNRSHAFVFDVPGAYRSTTPAGQTIFASIATFGMLIAHELGHLMGLSHEHSPNPSISRLPYSNGYLAVGARSSVGDAMIGLPPGAFFSNPRIACPNDVPCGHPDTADAARALKETRFEIAAISPTTWRDKGFGTGLWFNPRESGQGWSITQQGDTIFAIGFTHDLAGNPTWLVGSDLRRQPDEGFHGRIYRVKQGLPLDQATGRPAILDPSDIVDIGNAVLSFNSPDWAQISLDIALDGRRIRIAHGLSRMRFTSQPQTCRFSNSAPPDFAGAWNRASEAGWGLFTSHEGDVMFGVIMTYDSARAPMWRSASSLVRQPDGSYQGDLFQTRGVPFDAAGGTMFRPLDSDTNDAASVHSVFVATPSKVGEMVLRFQDGNTGRLGYRDDAIAVEKPMERYRFGSPLAACQ